MLRPYFSYRLPIVLSLLLIATLSIVSCTKSEDTSATAAYVGDWRGSGCVNQEEKWNQKASMFSNGRQEAFAFTVDDQIYVGGGDRKKDFWSYNPKTNIWAQLPDVPGTLFWRRGAVGFSVDNGYGYVCLGTDIDQVYSKYVFKFDVSSSVWTLSDSVPATMPLRKGAFTFQLGDSVFIGGGIATNGKLLHDLWVYLPSIKTWYHKNDLPFELTYTSAFAIEHDGGHDGYITCGITNSGIMNNTYRYDRVADAWIMETPFPAPPRFGGVAFTLGNGLAYVGLGMAFDSSLQKDMYIYHPTTKTWSNMKAYSGGPMAYGVAASLNGQGYVGTGTEQTNGFSSRWFQYSPDTAGNTTYKITAGPTNFTIYLKYTIGEDSCAHDISLLGTINSDKIKNNFTMATQKFVDACGRNYSISGSGSLNEDKITITTLTSSEKGVSACTFTGSK